MKHLTKLLRDSYDLQEEYPEKSAYWHLQQLRSEIKQLAIPVVNRTFNGNRRLTFDEWVEQDGVEIGSNAFIYKDKVYELELLKYKYEQATKDEH